MPAEAALAAGMSSGGDQRFFRLRCRRGLILKTAGRIFRP